MKSEIAVIGMGVMGRNLAFNIADRGFKTAIYNRSFQKTKEALDLIESQQSIQGFKDLSELVNNLETPRKVILMLTAGEAVDNTIEKLLLLMSPGDIIIDGGNSNFHDTERRYKALSRQDFLFIGAGISGGEEGARYGPSIMVGGDAKAWPLVKPYLQSIAAMTDDGDVCCQWVGDGGAGHYVKMIHNGIEYGDMQLIAEIWYLMDQLGFADDEISEIFAQWNTSTLSSYLIEITADILKVKETDGSLRVHSILDSAGQKGTGRWTSIDSFEIGAPLTLITQSVYARVLSSFKEQRQKANDVISVEIPTHSLILDDIASDLHDALYASKIISYAQGFMQMNQAATEYKWDMDFGQIALLWRAGCIIRSVFLKDIKNAFEETPKLENLILDQYFSSALIKAQNGWRNTCILGLKQGVSMPATTAALAFFDGYRSANSSANLLQAQRDYFGAHTYQRIDKDLSKSFHTLWNDDLSEVEV